MIPPIGKPKDFTKGLVKLTREFGKVARFKTNTQWSVAFAYTKVEQKKNTRKISLIRKSYQKCKYLGINLINYVKDLSMKAVKH